MTNDKHTGLYIYNIICSIGYICVSVIMIVFVSIGKMESAQDKTSITYQNFGANGLKYTSIFAATILLFYGIYALTNNINALRRLNDKPKDV